VTSLTELGVSQGQEQLDLELKQGFEDFLLALGRAEEA
jgi:hypothetical protein